MLKFKTCLREAYPRQIMILPWPMKAKVSFFNQTSCQEQQQRKTKCWPSRFTAGNINAFWPNTASFKVVQKKGHRQVCGALRRGNKRKTSRTTNVKLDCVGVFCASNKGPRYMGPSAFRSNQQDCTKPNFEGAEALLTSLVLLPCFNYEKGSLCSPK